jgi:hypothetical protein
VFRHVLLSPTRLRYENARIVPNNSTDGNPLAAAAFIELQPLWDGFQAKRASLELDTGLLSLSRPNVTRKLYRALNQRQELLATSFLCDGIGVA